MKISHLGLLPASVRLVSCIRLFDRPAGDGSAPVARARVTSRVMMPRLATFDKAAALLRSVIAGHAA